MPSKTRNRPTWRDSRIDAEARRKAGVFDFVEPGQAGERQRSEADKLAAWEAEHAARRRKKARRKASQ